MRAITKILVKPNRNQTQKNEKFRFLFDLILYIRKHGNFDNRTALFTQPLMHTTPYYCLAEREVMHGGGGRGPRWRSRKTWLEVVKNDMKNLGLASADALDHLLSYACSILCANHLYPAPIL